MKKKTGQQQFASDNYSGICPEVWKTMEVANQGHCPAYGDDEWTGKASDKFRELFDEDCEVFFVFNGTAGNALSLASICQSYNSVISHRFAHVATDECGAPEFFSNGAKILVGEGKNGKLTPEIVTELATKRSDLHFPKSKALSLTQATEVGTIYQPSELQAICGTAKEHGLKIHMDGARFANAVAATGYSPRELSVDWGIDILCFGGTKNGMAIGDAILFFDKSLSTEFQWRCKQAGQLASKMRYIAAPWVAMLQDETWLKNARHANEQAAYLEARLAEIEGVEINYPREINTLFVDIPLTIQEQLAGKGWRFYYFDGVGVRFMCSWDTSRDQIDQFIADITEAFNSL